MPRHTWFAKRLATWLPEDRPAALDADAIRYGMLMQTGFAAHSSRMMHSSRVMRAERAHAKSDEIKALVGQA